MSIAVLSQVFTEARRLMIAGSVVARGDFRLKKLIPSLEQAGKQAPVFAKLAETAHAVIDGPEDSSAASLLELTSLVNAVLYTQGETGLGGKLVPIETTDLGGAMMQTSARVLKPLLESLSSTGSGRLELVKEAHGRGQFRDIRLIKPALGALDDPYPEIAELIAEKVLPMYGKAILPELLAKYDQKGTKGHPRRLKLMYAIDPVGTRTLVKAALEGGSKEVKVVAISCLGTDAEDLPYLVEQASAKAQDVRAAAYQALAKVDKPEAVTVLAKALTGKDQVLAANAIEQSPTPKLVDLLVTEIRAGIDSLANTKDKKQVSATVIRTNHFLRSLSNRDHAAAETLLLELFKRREELQKIKGDSLSGSDVIETVIYQMSSGSKASKRAIVKAHAEVPADQLGQVFHAARQVLTPAQLYDTFAPYLTAKVDEKKKGKDLAWAQREAVMNAIHSGSNYYFYWYHDDEDLEFDDKALPKYDPRWLDLAVNLKRARLIHALARPDHTAAKAYAKAEFEDALKKAKTPDDVRDQLALMMRLVHPDRIEAFFAALAKRGKKTSYYHYWFIHMVRWLPKEAIPQLEELVATIPENEADNWLEAIQELRTKA